MQTNNPKVKLHSGNRLDDVDEQLLALLREDARYPIAQLAKDLNLPRSQVYARLARLEETEVISSYTVRLGRAYSESRIRAHMMIKTEARCHREVEAALALIPRVQAVHAISGEYDIIAMLEAPDSRQLNDLIDDIGLLNGIDRTCTSVILATKLER